ncbi:RTA1-domain-containing protein [Flagelloscypha sp. PMI_526]|nr:RTA1-domain-containing protein [Flagelloscypha sp. PMI_526]
MLFLSLFDSFKGHSSGFISSAHSLLDPLLPELTTQPIPIEMIYDNSTLVIRASSEPHVLDSPYGYTPTAWICVIFLSLFGVSGTIHLIQALWFKTYWLIPTAVLCALGEVLGWSGRLWNHYNVEKDTPFMIQISCTIISPTFLLAINFLVFGRVVNLLGQEYSLLPSRWISILFISADLIALVVQGVGGGLASGDQPVTGGNIMLGGIAFQFAIMIIACLLAFHFTWSWKSQHPVRKSIKNVEETEMLDGQSYGKKKAGSGPTIPLDEPEASRLIYLIWAIGFSTFFLFVRAIYRLIELSDGWTGQIITTEKWFNIFDGAMVVLAIWTVNIANPAWLLPKQHAQETNSA